MPTTTSFWKPLAPSPSPDGRFDGKPLPTFLISTAFTTNSYDVHLTDLTHIWSETLSRKAIITRSQSLGTSIELEQDGDEENLHIFLQKIKSALEGQDGSTIELAIDETRDRLSLHSTPALLLNVTAEVKHFTPLQWSIKLAAVAPSLLTSRFVVPLIRAQYVRMKEMASLMEVLREKDHVIQKLVDRLESQGADLGQVFPGAAGMGGRKSSRAWAEERVRGLGPFDENHWRNGQRIEDMEHTKRLLEDVFGTKNASELRIEDKEHLLEHQEKWWESEVDIIHLNAGTAASVEITLPWRAEARDWSRSGGKGKTFPKPPSKNSTQEMDDFQVQATPPGRGNAGPSSKRDTRYTVPDSSDDEDDLDRPSQPIAIPDSFPSTPPPPPKSKPSKIGGLRRSTPPSKPAVIAASNFDDNTDTEGEPSLLPTPTPKKGRTSPVPTAAETKKGQLDTLVSKNIEDTETESEPDSPEQPTSHKRIPSPPPAATSHENLQLGKAGGRKILESDTESEPSSSRQPTPAKEPTPPAPEITAPQKRGKLGKLGRMRKEAVTTPTSLPPTAAASETALPEKKTQGKLGGLRHKKPNTPAATVVEKKDDDCVEERGRGRGETRSEKEEHRETSKERADRKRDELKRQLEEKAKVPVKKKRKF